MTWALRCLNSTVLSLFTTLSTITHVITKQRSTLLTHYARTPLVPTGLPIIHYNDVIMSAMASQITSLTIVYSSVYSVADQRKHQSSASLAFVRGIHRWPVNSPHKGPVTRKCFHLMTSSCSRRKATSFGKSKTSPSWVSTLTIENSTPTFSPWNSLTTSPSDLPAKGKLFNSRSSSINLKIKQKIFTESSWFF